MSLSKQLSTHFREVFYGGNWTASNLNNHIQDIQWTEAVTPVYSFNTIAKLVYHIGYYVSAINRVLEGHKLDAKDDLSFNHLKIEDEEAWNELKNTVFAEANLFASLVSELPESRLWEVFEDEKYGTYYRNIQGVIEHTHYHLGQIVIIKKLLRKDLT